MYLCDVAAKRSEKILIGKKAAMEFIGIRSENLFSDLVSRGLPVVVINNRWYAHTENLEDFFKAITRRGKRTGVG